MKSKSFINATILKIIACIAMTFDHVGKFLVVFHPSETATLVNNIFSIIGRIALPIFIFLIFEGYKHTRSIKNYFARLGIAGAIVGLALILISSFSIHTTLIFQLGNIFIDLLIALLAIYLFNKERIIYKILAFLPIIYMALGLLIKSNIIPTNILTKEILSGFLPQYPIMTTFIVYFYLITKKVYDTVVFKNKDMSLYEKEDLALYELQSSKIIFTVTLVLLSFLMWGLTYANLPIFYDPVRGTYYFLAGLFIMFYNGKIMNLPKFTKYAFYLYYPLHIGIIFLLMLIIK